MTQSHFSLSWDAHQKNICNGLSSLQQNGEFVDMTIAADGHMVKVHQVIIALASPYIKELIASAQCPHPVVFLNNISYSTLCSILEYIYTGEAMVSIEDINKLAEAGRQLHIKGLEEMKVNQVATTIQRHDQLLNMKMEAQPEDPETSIDEEICYFEITSPKDNESMAYRDTTQMSDLARTDSLQEQLEVYDETMAGEGSVLEIENSNIINVPPETVTTSTTTAVPSKETKPPVQLSSAMQYTVSTQGSLQMILNRFVYYLKHCNRRDGTRQWRCVDYLSNTRCPAYVVTQDDVVLQRVSAHSHFFHDKKILKKVQAGAIFTAIQEAVDEGKYKKTKTKTEDV